MLDHTFFFCSLIMILLFFRMKENHPSGLLADPLRHRIREAEQEYQLLVERKDYGRVLPVGERLECLVGQYYRGSRTGRWSEKQ